MTDSHVIDLSVVDVLARTIYGEARGEGEQGMIAVANVILNRVKAAMAGKSRWWGKDIAGVCKCPAQFSCWNKSDPNCKIITSVTETDSVFQECRSVATQAIMGTLKDNTNGATSYYAESMKMPPYWARGKRPCATIGNHIFFNDLAKG